MWANNKNSLVADEMGLGKTASVITFIQCLRYDLCKIMCKARVHIYNWT